MSDRAPVGAAAAAPESDAALHAVLLAGLVCLLPFEPRRPTLPLPGFDVTLLEAGAGVIGLLLAWSARARLAALARRPPLPLVFISLYAAAHVVSAWAAPTHADLAAKFALRMVVMASYAWLIAAVPAGHRAALVALAAAGCLVGLTAVAEGSGVRALDPLLNRFREMPFNVAGSRRASGFTEYPNLAAAFLLYALQAGTSLFAARPTFAWSALPFSALLGAGLLFTYSRGALVAAAVGLGVSALVLALGSSLRAAAPAWAALAVLAACSGASALAGETFRLRLSGEGTSDWYRAKYEPGEERLHLRPGELVTTPVRVTNSGRKVWAVNEQFHLSYHWWNLRRQLVQNGDRTTLPHDVKSGESVLLQANVRAPEGEGEFLLVWDMVHEQTTWFTGQGVAPRAVPVTVSLRPHVGAPRSAPPRVTADIGWQPGRRELWRLALGMWRERPLVGVGPDNFRWLYGPRAGRATWDSRVFANNLFLEAAATTGTFGLLAICGTLVASIGVAARAAMATPAPVATATCALAVAISAHGIVDYLLASTAHYLMLAVVVGMAGALSRRAAP